MLLSEIVKTLDRVLKPEIAYEWDNVGLLVGEKKSNIKKVMITLEITKKTLEEAKKKSIDLIISHHPIIFKPLKTITTDNEKTEILIQAIKNNIGIYSSHTNFDMIKMGLNDHVANLLELSNIKTIVYETSEDEGIGRIGNLKKEMNINEFCKFLMEKLELSDMRAVFGNENNIKRVAIVNGAGIEYEKEAKKLDCDIYITGDVKYHEAQDIKESGMNVIDAGHYGTEKHFNAAMEKILKDNLPKEIEIYISEVMEDPFVAIKA